MDGAGRLLRELPLVAPTGAVPTAAPTRPSFADSFNVIVPAALVSNGLQLKAQFQPTAASEAVIAPRVGGGRKLTHAVRAVQAAASRWSRQVSRSRFFCTLPVAPSGMLSTNTTSSGVHHLAILPS